MDNLNRRLMSFLTREDIPSSAIQLNANNYGSLTGNVLYVPIDYSETSVNSLPIKAVSNTAYITECCGFFGTNSNGTSAIYTDSSSTRSFSFRSGYTSNSNMYSPNIMVVASGLILQQLNFGFSQMTSSSGSNQNYYTPVSYGLGVPDNYQLFAKITFSNLIKVTPTSLSTFLLRHSVLIDNE